MLIVPIKFPIYSEGIGKNFPRIFKKEGRKMYNYYQPNQSIRQATAPLIGLKGRPVASIDEARAASIDFDGSIFFFPDLANKRIYTKQINMDGTASLLMYELKELPTFAEISSDNYVTREEFAAVIEQLKSALIPPEVNKEEPRYEF